MPVVCVLYDVLKKKKNIIEFPVWNDFPFCLTARQAEYEVISLLSACVRSRQIQRQSTAKLQVRFPIHVQNITIN